MVFLHGFSHDLCMVLLIPTYSASSGHMVQYADMNCSTSSMGDQLMTNVSFLSFAMIGLVNEATC